MNMNGWLAEVRPPVRPRRSFQVCEAGGQGLPRLPMAQAPRLPSTVKPIGAQREWEDVVGDAPLRCGRFTGGTSL